MAALALRKPQLATGRYVDEKLLQIDAEGLQLRCIYRVTPDSHTKQPESNASELVLSKHAEMQGCRGARYGRVATLLVNEAECKLKARACEG